MMDMSALIDELAPADLVAIAAVRRAALDGTCKRVRQLARVSQEELGRSCRVNPQTILRWESGQRRPRARAGERYAAAITALAASLGDTDDDGVRNLRSALGLERKAA
jgi:transcriptional regulator with XRE-family HTH domain